MVGGWGSEVGEKGEEYVMTRENDMQFKFQWLQLVLLRHRPIHSFAYCLAAFKLQQQSLATATVSTETVESTEANLFLSDLIRVCGANVRVTGACCYLPQKRKVLLQ